MRRRLTQVAVVLLSLLALALAVLLVLAMEDDDEGVTGEADTSTAVAAELPENWRRGANLTAYTPNGYATVESSRRLHALQTLGFDHVSLVPLWYMDTASSSDVHPDPAPPPTTAS